MSFAFFDSLFPTPVVAPGAEQQDLGYVVVASFPTEHFNEGEAPDVHSWFAWPSQKEDLVGFCLTVGATQDLYTVPAIFKTRSNRRAENIAHQWVVYADADSLDLKHLKVEPTMIVETSKDRHHVYWSTQTDDWAALCEVGRAIAHTHAHQGCDKGGWDAGQLLRVPSSMNTKYRLDGRENFEVRIKRHGKPVAIEHLKEAYPQVTPKIPTGTGGAMPPISEWQHNPDVAQDVDQVYFNNPDIEELATKPLRAGADRSGLMWRLLSDMVRAQVDKKTAMAIAWTATCNKYRLDRRTPEELWIELNKAYADPMNQPVTSEYEALVRRDALANAPVTTAVEALPNNPEKKAKEWAAGLSILSEEERAALPTDTFIDRYVAWASGRTDAPECYHRVGAMAVLTSLFGQYGMCPTKFPLNLTLWFMILGPTTRARKTTAMNLFVDMVGDMETSGHSYLLASNVTSEALAKVLPKRDGKTSVFYRDEVHGMFEEQDKKRYMSGLRELMTDLYTGNVPVTLRAGNITDDEEEDDLAAPKGRTKTNFVMFLCGTIQQVTNQLTVADYESGHLARFLAVEADPPPLTRERIRIEQHRGGHQEHDIRRRNLIIDLEKARDFWLHRTNGGRTKEIVYFDDPAWERLQDAIWYLTEKAQADPDLSELLTPTAQRMGMSMMKAAILIAMSEEKYEVSLRHVLKAIELTEEWYGTTAVIAGKVVSSTWQVRQEEMLVKIRSKRDGVTEQEIFRDFRTKRSMGEIEHDLAVLVRAGQVLKIPEQGGRIRYVAQSLR